MKNNLRFGKVIMVMSLIVAGWYSASAQEQQTAAEDDLRTKVGLKAGINLTNLFVDDVDDNNIKVGLNAGFLAKVPITRGLSIQPELLYSLKGSKLTYDNVLFGEGEYRFNLHYVEVPVLAVINIAKNLNLHAGAYAAYLVAADIKDVNDDGSIEEIGDLKADDFNRFDYGLVAGLGLDIENFTIGARYNYGMREIGDSGSLSGELANDARNSAVSLYIGFGF